MINWLFSIKKGWYFVFLCFASAIFAWLSNYFLTEILAYNVLSEQYTAKQIKIIMDTVSKWKYFAYAAIPIIILIRVLYTSFCLYVGNLVQEYQWEFKKLFNISLKADLAFLFSQILNFYYYVFVKPANTLDDINTNCASILNLVGRKNTPAWLISAYNSVNISEILYMVLLVLFLHNIYNKPYLKTTVFVILTYGIGTYTYIVTMTFLYLNYT